MMVDDLVVLVLLLVFVGVVVGIRLSARGKTGEQPKAERSSARAPRSTRRERRGRDGRRAPAS
jgi:hypothetical protein